MSKEGPKGRRRGLAGVLKGIGEASGMMTFDDEGSAAGTSVSAPVPILSTQLPVAPPDLSDSAASEGDAPSDSESSGVLLDFSFPDLYSRHGVVGNSQIDPILTAYSQMAPALQGEGLVTAMKAMMQGMGVAETAVIDTLAKRLDVLAQISASENAKAADRKTSRDQGLATFKEKAMASIADLERSIAELRQELSDRDRETVEANAGDFGAMKALEVKVNSEQTRLTALKTFLEGGTKP